MLASYFLITYSQNNNMIDMQICKIKQVSFSLQCDSSD
jgi:hypothetical protein